jgi:hypothetical protein
VDIYLDTNIWNELLLQDVTPSALVSALEQRSARVVLSDEAIYELARTFNSQRGNGHDKAKELFTYLRGYVDLSIPILKENMTLVAAEMQALQWQMREIYPYINASDYEIVRTMVAHLSQGLITAEEQARTDTRIAIRERDRTGIAAHVSRNPALRTALAGVSEQHLSDWLDREMNSRASLDYLADQIDTYFQEQGVPHEEVAEYALALRGAAANRVARAMTRWNLYLNWRVANRLSLSRDVLPDSTHIINSNYCDVYATKESGQASYARLLLTPATEVRIYDGQSPVDAWLVSLS